MNEKKNCFPDMKKFNFINETKIFNEIQNNKKILIIDLREKSHYENMSLPFSLNLPYDKNPEDFYSNFTNYITPDLTEDQMIKEMLYRYKRFYIAIIFSEEKFNRKDIIDWDVEKIKSFDSLNKALSMYYSFTSNRVREIGVCLKGFKRIYEKYSFIILNNLNKTLSHK